MNKHVDANLQPIADRLDRLDHLRLLACVMVMIWHFSHILVPTGSARSSLFAVFEEGHTGVSFFCVISGFIFAWLYGDRKIEYGAFMKRRLLRIAPLFLFVTFLGFLVEQGWTATQFLAMLTTIHIGPINGYGAPGWSALIEMQFYLLFPFLIVFMRKYGVRYLVAMIAFLLLIRCLIFIDKGSIQNLSYWTMFGRGDQFLAGMIAGALSKRASLSSRTSRPWLLTVAGAAIIVPAFMYLRSIGGFMGSQNAALWIVLPTIEAVAYALVVAGYILTNGSLSLFSRSAAYLGRISYSMYLMQSLVFAVIHKALISTSSWEMSLVWFAGVGFPAVAAVSAISYHLIEKPFLDLKDKSGRPNAAG